jgi:hypothetical protein
VKADNGGLGRHFFRSARQALREQGRLAALRYMRSHYGFSYHVAAKWLDEIAAEKPWTHPLTKSQKEFAA